MRALRAALVYCAIVFVAGFVLGTLRVLCLVPSIGVRAAELCEMPLMFLVIVLAARFVYRARHGELATPERALSGFIALALLVGAELSLVTLLQRQSIPEYLSSRDPVAGSVYVAMLLLFAVLPTALRHQSADPS